MNEKSKRQTDGHIGRQVNVRLKDADAERLDRLSAKHGGIAPTIKAALKALEGSNELTNADLLATLAARLKTDAEQNPKTERDIARDMPKTEIAPKSVKPNLLVTPPPRKIKDIDKA